MTPTDEDLAWRREKEVRDAEVAIAHAYKDIYQLIKKCRILLKEQRADKSLWAAPSPRNQQVETLQDALKALHSAIGET